MTTFFYKSGGRISRYLIDYGTYHIAQLGIDTLDDFWEEQYQTRRIEEITYGTVGDAGAYGIGSKIKSLRSTSYSGDDDQWSNGGYFIVGESGTSIGRFTNAWERRSYNYYHGIIDYYTEHDYGLISNTPTTINDCGSSEWACDIGYISTQPGDLNQDTVYNIIDIVLMVNIILGEEDANEYTFWASDINQDGLINIQDVILLINII